MALSLVAARDASAGRIAATDLDSLAAGSYVHRSFDWFVAVRTDVDPAHRQGILWSDVTFDGALYTYAHEVTPYLDDNNHFATLFGVNHFSGIAGWSFSDALRAGGTGTASDFALEGVGDRLHWSSHRGGLGAGAGANVDRALRIGACGSLRGAPASTFTRVERDGRRFEQPEEHFPIVMLTVCRPNDL